MSNTTFTDTKSKRTRTKTKRYSPTHNDNGYLHPKGNIGDAHYYRGGMGALNYFGKIVRKDMNDDNDNNDGTDLPTYNSEFIVSNSDDEDEYISSSDSEHESNSEDEMGIYKSSIEYLTQLASNIVKEMDYNMWEDWTK